MGSQGGNCRICTEVGGRKELKKTQKGSLLFCVFLSFLRPIHRMSRCCAFQVLKTSGTTESGNRNRVHRKSLEH